ncbi:hypothetical protein Tco_0690801 [Tanacetum coccineum]
METEEVSERYITPCFVEGLDAYDGETDLEYEKNMISNKFVVKLCLEYEFIINLEEDDVEPGVIFRRLFLRLTKGIVDFGNGILTIYPDLITFNDDSDDELDALLASIDVSDLPPLDISDIPSFVCKMGKITRNKNQPPKNYKMSYNGERPSLTINRPLTQEELFREDVLLDKLKLDGELEVEEEIVGEEFIRSYKAIKEKNDPGVFLLPIRGPMGRLLDVLCQVGVTTILASFLLLDIPVDRDVLIDVGRSFWHTCGAIMNTIKGTTSTFDGIVHQKFYVANVRNAHTESDSNDDEEYCLKRDDMRKPIYGPNHAKYLSCNDPMDRALALQEALNPFKNICICSPCIVDWNVLNTLGCAEAIEEMLKIKVYEMGGKEEIFTSEAWRRAFDIN